MKKSLSLTILLLALSLSACSWLGLDKDEDTKKEDKAEKEEMAPVKEVMPICPQTAIVRDLEELKDYGGETPADDQLVAKAIMRNVSGDCAYQDKGIDLRFDLNMAAAKGPRLGGLRVSFPYFVAVVDPDGKILNKERLTKEFHFASDSKIVEDSEPLHIFIPLAKEKRTTGPYYRVLMGFQLTEAQYETLGAGKSEQPLQ